MQGLVSDIRFSLRQLIKSPGFTATVVISLALGIGATTAVFSVIYAALIDPFPYRAVDRIVRLTVDSKSETADSVGLNGAQIQEVRKLPPIESVLAMDYHALTLTGRSVPVNVDAIGLISTGFTDLGMRMVLGRGLLPSDAIDGQDPQPVAVLSYKFWRQEFFGNPDVVGQKVQLDQKIYVVVGVVAPRFTWYSADVYLPLKLDSDPAHRCIVNIRLKPGVTHEVANTALQPLLEQFAKERPNQFPDRFKVHVEGLNEWVVRSMSGTLYLLFGAVALLLAIGCGNGSTMLLARGAMRQHELALRVAIGAGRARIVRQLLTESMLLAAIGVLAGVAMSYGILAGIQGVLPRFAFAPEVAIRINLPVLLFSAAVALATGILFGMWPALRLSRPQLSHMMQSNARRVAGSVHGRSAHNMLVAGQIALTLLLLAGAGSAVSSFRRLLETPLGYDPHNALSLGIPLHDNAYTTWAAREAYFEQLRAKVAETPGVIMTAISTNATPPRNGWTSKYEILGKPALADQMASINVVDPAYFALLQIPLLAGRLWTAAENHTGAHVAVINRTLARRYFPNGDAIRHSVRLPGLEDRPPVVLSAPRIAESWLPIVGVVEDARNDGLAKPIRPAVYIPYTLSMPKGTQILVKSSAPPLTLVRALRAQLMAVNPEQQTYKIVEDLETWISDEPEWQQRHLASWIFGLFAGLALALGAVGLYSVVSYTVAQRTNEFGIRMALGAQRGHVLRIVFASTLGCVGAGILAGLALTVTLSKILAQWEKGDSRDPWVLLAGTLLLCVVSGVACAIPAWRATRADPARSLRYE
jgi:predicted permease